MQKNVLAVVAITGSCAVLYILYRCKIFSRKNCIKAKDKNMGKSNCIKLNDDKKKYGNIINDSTELAISKSLLNSLNKSPASSSCKLNNHQIGFEDEMMSTMVNSVEFEDDSAAVLLESRNSLFEDSGSYLKLSSSDLGKIFEIDNDSLIDIKFMDLDVNKNSREPLEYLNYSLQSEICNNSSSVPLLLSHKTNILNCDSNGSENPQLNSMCEALLECCIESNIENKPLNKTNFEIDVPNLETNKLEIHQTHLEDYKANVSSTPSEVNCKADINTATIEVNYKTDSNASIGFDCETAISNTSLEVDCTADVSNTSSEVLHSNSLNCSDKNFNNCTETNTDYENKNFEEQSTDIEVAVIPKDQKFIRDEDNCKCVKQCDCTDPANLCNCDNVDKTVRVIAKESETVPSVRPKTKKPKKRRNKQMQTNELEIEASSSCIESNFTVNNQLENANPISNCDSHFPDVPTKKEYNVDLHSFNQNPVDINADWANVQEPFASTVKLENMEEFSAYEFEVPQTLVGRLIGKQGNFINKIKNETNTKMAVITSEDKKIVPVCYVHGTHQQVVEALKRIRERFPAEDFPDLTMTQINLMQLSTPIHISHNPLQIQIPPGICVEVKASYIVSPGELWLQQHVHPSFHKLGDLHRLMNAYYGDGSTTPQFEMPAPENSVCVCWLDVQWFRCAIINQNYLTVSVRLLDLGNVVTVPIHNLRQILTPDYTRLELQAAKAMLYGLMPTNGIRYNEEIRAELIGMLSDANLVATVNAYGPNMEPMIKLYIKCIDKYTYVNKELVEKGFAKIAPGMTL